MDHSSGSADGEQSHAQRLIKPYYELFNNLSKDVNNDYLQELCTLCHSLDIPEEKFECDTPLELFLKLDKYGSIGEDNTGFLKDILRSATHNEGVEMVELYEKERQEHLKNVEDLLKENDPLFVGRTAFVRKILEVFQDSHSTGCRCVLVYGLAGTGKTKLAVESCALYKEQQKGSRTRLFKVNLHKATTNNEVWLWTFSSLTGKQVSYKQFEITLFIELVNGLIKVLTKLGHRNFPQALAEYELNTTNVLHFLEIDMGRKFDSKSTDGQQDLQESLPPLNTREELYSMFQTFLDPIKRLEYYEIKSEQMRGKNEVVGWAYLRGWVGDEQATLAQYSKALKTIEEPLKRVRSGKTIDSERAKAKLLYVKGRICSETEEFSDAINLLEEALSIYQRLLGAHTVTARCLNALGHAYYNEAEESRVETGTKAMEYHQKAWDMLEKITNGHPRKHFDAPEYLLNIGASYHQAGKNIGLEKKANDLYRRAIKTYEEALKLAESLKLTKLPSTAYMLKNIAMSYYEMGEYEKALPRAKEAGQIREATCRLHPATARNLYFIGSLHEKIGDKLKTAGQTRESGQQLLEGLEHFKKALRVEFQLEKHTSEYDYLKKDTIELMEKLHMDKDIEKYRLQFQREDEKASCSTDEQTSTSYLEDGVEASMHQRPHGSVMIEIDGEDSQGEGAGVSKTRKRKTPGPVMLEESPNKVCRCC